MDTYSFKRISDPVHGTIGLSKPETQILGTRTVQRLRNVKQLGLAHLVFPGANYSRLSHALGVCHITGQILASLRSNGTKITDEEIQLYRLAGLLHDVGHYPFSHATEEAIKDFYAASLYREKSGDASGSGEDDPSHVLEHELVGRTVLTEDPEIRPILEGAALDPRKVYQIFARIDPPKFSNLVSSDFDADRIDYLLRTAHHSGLPYGSVDLPYLLSQVRTDGNGRVCLTSKALRTADHFLLCRYFDYQQVAFHKTVAAFEWLLKDVVIELLQRKILDCSGQSITNMISSGTWERFDDSYLLERIQDLCGDAEADEDARRKAQAILWRRPPKLIAEAEFLGKHDETTLKNHRLQKRAVSERLPALARDFGVSEKLLHLWTPIPMTLTKIGSHVPISAIAEDKKPGDRDKEKDRAEQAIRVLDSGGSTSKEIVRKSHSLMSILSDWALYSFRLYLLCPEERPELPGAMRKKIREEVGADLELK